MGGERCCTEDSDNSERSREICVCGTRLVNCRLSAPPACDSGQCVDPALMARLNRQARPLTEVGRNGRAGQQAHGECVSLREQHYINCNAKASPSGASPHVHLSPSFASSTSIANPETQHHKSKLPTDFTRSPSTANAMSYCRSRHPPSPQPLEESLSYSVAISPARCRPRL